MSQTAVAVLTSGLNFKKTTGVYEGKDKVSKVNKVKLKCTWGSGRRSSPQGPEYVRRTMSNRAEHLEL